VEKRDLKRLCEASNYLYRIAVPILYERITVSAKDEHLLNDIDVAPILKIHHTLRHLLRHTKHIEVVSRCIHRRIGDRTEGDEEDSSRLDRQAAHLMPFLEGFRENSLRSFTYVSRLDY
jgi:hypothetical protein